MGGGGGGVATLGSKIRATQQSKSKKPLPSIIPDTSTRHAGEPADYTHFDLLRWFWRDLAKARQKLLVLGGLRKEERAVLEARRGCDRDELGSEADSQGILLSTDARVAMVEGWFMRRLIGRQKFEQGRRRPLQESICLFFTSLCAEGESSATSPPILSRLGPGWGAELTVAGCIR